jgi:ectoine hydroxylase-related dioxygenase (phytanoyl-CoA dioxygenase family)
MNASPSDALPALDDDFQLPPEDIRFYQQNGHVIVRSLASPEEVAAFRPAVVEAALKHSRETRPLAERDTYAKAFLQIENLWQKDEIARRFILSRRFARVAAQLMQVDGVRLYHDNALFKEPGGGPTAWHQDQHYWPLDTNNTVTLWMPLVDISEEMGSLTFGDGTHTLGHLGHFDLGDKSQQVFSTMIEERNIHLQTYGAMKAGDATFHAGWTLHAAPGNPTETMREVVNVIYYTDGTRVLAPDNKARETDLRNNLPGLKGGDLAVTEMNPLLS